MPTFATPEPISLRVKVTAGDVTVEASARTDTDVEVRPADPERSDDVAEAEATTVTHRDGTVVVETPEHHRSFGRSPEVTVRVRLPDGSNVRVHTASGDVRISGAVGETDIDTASGDVDVDHAQRLWAKAASGDITVRTVDGDAKVSSASGDVSLELVHGTASASSASGDVVVREVYGTIDVSAASGDARVGRAHGSVSAKAASGDLTVDSVQRGQVTASSASGEVWIGVAAGPAAWLELNSLTGEIRSELEGTDDPGTADETVTLQVETVSGDITIARAH